MRMLAVLLIGGAAMLGDIAHADSDPDAPAGHYPPSPAPAAALAGFGAIAGHWACQGSVAAGALSPGSPAAHYLSTFEVTALFGGRGYAIAYEQRFADDPMVFTGTWYGGWDEIGKSLTFLWLDNMGTVGRERGAGWINGTLRLTGEGSAGGRHALLRDTFALADDTTLRWKGEMKFGGAAQWVMVGEDICRKQPPVGGRSGGA